jgi:glycine/D-amino acid oxidase-like deaminating enzyme
MRAGIAVVGGGMVGAWVASELARRADPLHAPVVLFEAGHLEDVAPAWALLIAPDALDGALRPALADGARALAQFETLVGRGIGFGRPGWLRLGAGEPGGQDLSKPAFAFGLEAAAIEGAAWAPDAGLFDPQRLHAEVLGLGRTRGLVTRASTCVEALIRDAGGHVVGLETSRGRVDAEKVLVVDAAAAERLVPELAPPLESSDRAEIRLGSPLFEGAHALLGTARGSTHDLLDLAADPESLDAFFGAGEALEFPHPCFSVEGLDVWPDALTGELVVAACADSLPADPRPRLAELASVFRELGAPTPPRLIRISTTASGRPLLGELGGGLFAALGLGLHEAQLAAGLAPGLVALMHGEPVAAFDPAAFALEVIRRGRS